MSVEENPVDEEQEVDEVAAAEAEMINFFLGESEAEEPENSEQPEVEVEAEENHDSVEPEPEPPVVEETPEAEGQEESALPEWAKELPIDDDEMADAVEFFAGGERADWTRLPHKDMTEDQLSKLRKAQSEFNRWEAAQKVTEDPEVANRKQIEKDLYDMAKAKTEAWKASQGIQEPKQEEEVPVTKDVREKVRELMESGDTDAAMEALAEGLREENERKLAEIEKSIEAKLEEKLSSKLTEKQHNDYLSSHNAYLEELAESDPRFAPALEVGSELNLALKRVFQHPIDQVTGEVLVDGKDAREDLNRAYNYVLGRSRGGKRVVNRPSISAQPPAGSVSGETPEISKSDLDDPDYFHLPHVYKEFEKAFGR